MADPSVEEDTIRSNAERSCARCGASMFHRRRSAAYCCERCRKLAEKSRWKKRFRKRRQWVGQVKRCPSCEEEFRQLNPQHSFCSRECRTRVMRSTYDQNYRKTPKGKDSEKRKDLKKRNNDPVGYRIRKREQERKRMAERALSILLLPVQSSLETTK